MSKRSDRLLKEAIAAYHAGDLTAAERLGKEAARAGGARMGMAFHLLGAVQRDAGRPREAEQSCRRAIALDARNADAYANLGLCLGDQGMEREGIEAQRKALQIDPGHSNARINLASALLQCGEVEEAQQEFEAALRQQPSSAALRGAANCKRRRGDHLGALAVYRQWLAHTPDDVAVRSELGATLIDLHRWVEAKDELEQALALEPTAVTALANLGAVYKKMYKNSAALDVWQRALRLKPDTPELLVNLGSLYRDLGRSAEAEAALRRAIELNPRYANAYNNLGNVHRDEGRCREAREDFLQAIAIDPGHWTAWSNLLFVSQNISGLPPPLIADEHRRFGEAVRNADGAARMEHRNEPDPQRVLRIGYLSPDFKAHSVSYFIEPILACHDRAQVHVTCFANQSAIDPVTERLQRLADKWHFVENLPDERLAELIRDERIDILVDLAGHTANNRLLTFARRPAPVQVTWIGYPDTTGLAEMDYRLTDGWADPEGMTEQWHTEKLYRLDQGFLCYAPVAEAPPPAEPPCVASGSVTFGSFNSLSKLDAQSIALWSEVLRAVPGSRLLLKSLAFDDADCRERYLGAFEQQGVERGRLLLKGKIGSQREHLAAYAQVDIALDTFPYHGTTTTCEALWMGVPVVTLAGSRHVSRVGVSLLAQVGMAELIAHDEEHFIAIAKGLADDPTRLTHLRGRLRDAMATSPLCDARAKTSAVEAALRTMWRTWCAAAGEVPGPPSAEEWISQGIRQSGEGHWDEAEAAFRRATLAAPTSALAWNNLGVALTRLGRPAEAIAACRAAIAAHPDYAPAHSNLAAALLDAGEVAAAEAAGRAATRADPHYAKGHVNLALALAAGREYQPALQAYEAALALGLEDAEVYLNLSATLCELGRLEQAATACERALALREELVEARANLSVVLIAQGRLAEGVAQARRVMAARPDLAKAWSSLLLAMEYDDGVTREELLAAHRAWGAQFGGKAGAFSFGGHSGRLRLGFVSADLSAHPVGFFLEPLLDRLDRTAFEIFIYSAHGYVDPVTSRLKALADHWHSIVGLDAAAAARQIHQDGIDILFDLSGHTRGNRLDVFALRPAPVQVTWLGYPDTTGLPEMDFRLSDPHADPVGEAERWCSERIVRLPTSFLCYRPLLDAPAPSVKRGPVTFGSFNNLSKISPTTIRLWSRILAAVPDARLLIKAKALADDGTRRRLAAAFAQQGIGEERLLLRGWSERLTGHLEQYREVDIALDTFPYHGTTTTCEALSMGVPVVTLAGTRHAARVGVSLLSQVGLTRCIAASEQEYVAIATAVASDPQRLAALRAGLRERVLASPLCDEQRFAGEFAAACRALWEQWCGQTSESRSDMRKISIPLGLTLCVPDHLDELTAYVLLEQGDWHEDEIRWVRLAIEPASAAVDIGAGYGVFTLTLAALVGAAGRVWSFEPAGAAAGFLEQSLKENALAQVERVRTMPVTLDTLAAQAAPTEVAFVRLAPEYTRLDVVVGGARLFAAHAPLVMLGTGNGEAMAVVESFAAQGYDSYRWLPALEILAPFDARAAADALPANLFFCMPQRARRLAERGLLVPAQEQAALPPTPVDHWYGWLQGQPWAGALLPNWARRQDAADGWREYREALNAYVVSRDSGQTMATRRAALRRSHELLRALGAHTASLPRLCSLARVAAELGERAQACTALRRIQARLQQGGAFDLNEPFVPVDARFEGIAPQARLGDWFVGSILETLERLGAPSSCFNPDDSRRLLEPAVKLAFASEQARRRLSLIEQRLAAGAKTPAAAVPIRLHLGGRQAKPGWKILNIQAGPHVDFVGSITDLSQFADASVAEIYGSHVLEHVSYVDELLPTLQGFRRVLVPGGRLLISVPDLERLARLFLSPQLDRKQKFHVMRMMFGGQIDPFDFHHTGFSFDILGDYLTRAGFVDIERVERFGLFDDTSDYAPFGQRISLNVQARKAG